MTSLFGIQTLDQTTLKLSSFEKKTLNLIQNLHTETTLESNIHNDLMSTRYENHADIQFHWMLDLHKLAKLPMWPMDLYKLASHPYVIL